MAKDEQDNGREGFENLGTPGEEMAAERNLRDALARMRHQADQGSEASKLLGGVAANFFAGAFAAGAPEHVAVTLAAGYIRHLVEIGQQRGWTQ